MCLYFFNLCIFLYIYFIFKFCILLLFLIYQCKNVSQSFYVGKSLPLKHWDAGGEFLVSDNDVEMLSDRLSTLSKQVRSGGKPSILVNLKRLN